MSPRRSPAGRLLPLLLVLAVALSHAVPAAAQGRRVAFVIGIDQYQSVDRLTRARNDANAVAGHLRTNGFEVVLRTDADRRAINDGMSEFEEKLRGAEVGFFFFAGHGVEIRGTNVLLPADLPATLSETVVLREGLLLADVAQLMADSGVRYSVLVIDACRDNPLPRTAGRTVGRTRGLGRADAPRGTYVVYSAGIGEAALDRLSDSDTSPNSVFTRHLLPALDMRGISLDTAIKQVRERVREDAASVRHQQNPAIYDQATGELYIIPAPPTPPTPPPAAPPPPAPAVAPAPDGTIFETLFWQSIQATNRPAELRAYLDRWPDGIFAPLARARLAEREAAAPAPAAPVATPPPPPARESAPAIAALPAPPAPPPPVREAPPNPAAIPAPPALTERAPEPGEIRRAQLRLGQLGLDPGPADGMTGPRTRTAMRVFRAAAGLPPGEEFDEAARARLLADPPPARPDLGRALAAAAQGARESRQWPEALRLLDLSLRLSPEPATRLTLADLQRDLGRVEQARRLYAELRRLDPNGEAGKAAAARLAELPAPRPETRPEAGEAVTARRVGPGVVPGAPSGACGVSFVGSRADPDLRAHGYTFANSCATEMVYRPVCPGNSNVGRGDLVIGPRSSTTVWALAGRSRDPGFCTIQSARAR